LRAARIESGQNPAHPLANAPGRYHHVNSELPTARPTDAPEEYGEVPPPSRADRHASD
jgi:hypothetical protein